MFTCGDVANVLPNELFGKAPLGDPNEKCEAMGAGVGSVDIAKACTFLPPGTAVVAGVLLNGLFIDDAPFAVKLKLGGAGADAGAGSVDSLKDCTFLPPAIAGDAAVFDCVLAPNWNPDVNGTAVFGCVLEPNWKPDTEGAAVFDGVLEPNWKPDTEGAAAFDCVLEPNWKPGIEGTVAFCWLFMPFKIFGSMLFKKPEVCGGCCFVGEVCLGFCEREPFDLAWRILLHLSASAGRSLSA